MTLWVPSAVDNRREELGGGRTTPPPLQFLLPSSTRWLMKVAFSSCNQFEINKNDHTSVASFFSFGQKKKNQLLFGPLQTLEFQNLAFISRLESLQIFETLQSP